jgi:uncharacterized membrane protein YqgA involved in biofilm formation
MTGTFVNAAAVIVGSAVGLLFRARLPERITAVVFQAIGLFTLFMGIKMAWASENVLVLVLSMVIGAVIGEALGLEQRVDALAERAKGRLRSDSSTFSQGLISAFLLFCTGSMTILGSIQEGLGLGPDLLLAKSVLDGFAAMALAAGLGAGVLFSALPLLLLQGALTLSAGAVQPLVTESMIAEMGAAGGLLLLGLSLGLLDLAEVKVVNMLPALPLALTLAAFVR